MIAGLYPYARGGVVQPPTVTLGEIPVSLAANPNYREDLLILAGDAESAAQLMSFGLTVHRVFDDAPMECGVIFDLRNGKRRIQDGGRTYLGPPSITE